jgi:hypothetical protein
MTPTPRAEIRALFGFIRIDSGYVRSLSDGSVQFGCRVRKYDNKPSESEHMVSDEMHWNAILRYA